jgi:hypothetical protein
MERKTTMRSPDRQDEPLDNNVITIVAEEAEMISVMMISKCQE